MPPAGLYRVGILRLAKSSKNPGLTNSQYRHYPSIRSHLVSRGASLAQKAQGRHRQDEEGLQMAYEVYGTVAFLCAVISARWALELNYSQTRQLVCFLGGLLLGPLMPLIMYLRLVQNARRPAIR
jgi:hypothetical protein